MTRARDRIRALLAGDGIVRSRDHPGLARTMERMVADAELARLLPGTYTAPGDERLTTRLRAVCRRFPDAVVTGAGAAAATFWPDIDLGTITVARPLSMPTPSEAYRFTHRELPPQLVRNVDGVRLTAPALTALDLTQTYGTDVIDRVLRRRATTVGGLHRALAATRGRRGNIDRLRVLLDSRAAPWSAAERLAHRLLRDAGVTGWVANLEIHVRLGWFIQVYYLDIAFPATRRVLEIEGNSYHGDRRALNQDRYRHNDIVVRAGWESLRVDWPMLTEDPDYVVELGRYAEGRGAA